MANDYDDNFTLKIFLNEEDALRITRNNPQQMNSNKSLNTLSYFSLASFESPSSSLSLSSCDTCPINPSEANIGFFNYSYQGLFSDDHHYDNDSQQSKADMDFDENVFHKIDSLLMSNINDLDATWELINYLIKDEDLNNEMAEKFITSTCINKYLQLLQQLIQSSKSGHDEKEIRLRMDKFCRNLIIQEPEIILMFIPHLVKLSKYNNFYVESVSNFYFANFIKFHLLYMDTNNIEVSINDQEMNNIVQWLYPKYNLTKLFEFIETARGIVCDNIIMMFDLKELMENDNNSDNNKMLETFLESQNFLSLPILERMCMFLLHQDSMSYNERLKKSLLVFCLRATIFEQALHQFKQWIEQYNVDEYFYQYGSYPYNNSYNNGNQSNLTSNIKSTVGKDGKQTTNNINSGSKLSSPYLVGQLYQLAIDLALLAASFNQPNLINQLLCLRLADLEFEPHLKKAMEEIDSELNTIEDRIVQGRIIQDRFNENLNSFESIDSNIGSLNNDVTEPSLEQSNYHRKKRPIGITLKQKRQLLEKIKMQGTNLIAPVNNKWFFGECVICCEFQWLLIRFCCSFGSCLECLTRYYTSKIKMGILSIECIGPDCKELVYRAEVMARLVSEDKALYSRLLLMQSSESDRNKPCPRCNKIFTLSNKQHITMKRAKKKFMMKRLLMFGFSQSLVNQSKSFKIKCEACQYDWCFKCHSPWHEGLSCKDYIKGDSLLKSWAKHMDIFTGEVNAQKCPKCKIYIQRINGCDHMHCTRCKTDFCYRCGDRIRHLRFFGDHYSRLSVLGCKYRYKPENPIQRRLVRGAVLGSKLMVLPVLTTICLCTGALLLAVGVAAMPFVGGIYFYNRIRRQVNHDFSNLHHYLNMERDQRQFLSNNNNNNNNDIIVRNQQQQSIDGTSAQEFSYEGLQSFARNIPDSLISKNISNHRMKVQKMLNSIDVAFDSDDDEDENDDDDNNEEKLHDESINIDDGNKDKKHGINGDHDSSSNKNVCLEEKENEDSKKYIEYILKCNDISNESTAVAD